MGGEWPVLYSGFSGVQTRCMVFGPIFVWYVTVSLETSVDCLVVGGAGAIVFERGIAPRNTGSCSVTNCFSVVVFRMSGVGGFLGVV